MAWRVARSLDQLLAQINAVAPSRNKLADGSIGDPAHAATASDHNPDSRGIVHARDFTHDPAHGADMHAFAASLAASADYRIKYLIWNRRITQWQSGRLVWVYYSGTNPHTGHMHVSVNTNGEDDTRRWTIGGATPAQPTPVDEDEDMARIMRATGKPDAFQDGAVFIGLNAEESKNLAASGAKVVWITPGTWDALANGRATGQPFGRNTPS